MDIPPLQRGPRYLGFVLLAFALPNAALAWLARGAPVGVLVFLGHVLVGGLALWGVPLLMRRRGEQERR